MMSAIAGRTGSTGGFSTRPGSIGAFDSLGPARGAVVQNAVREAGRRVFVDDRQLRQVASFVLLYLATFALGVLVLAASGFGLQDAIFEFASGLGTVGLSVGATRADMPDAALAALMVAMFLGRLEFTVVIASVLKIAADVRAMARGDGR